MNPLVQDTVLIYFGTTKFNIVSEFGSEAKGKYNIAIFNRETQNTALKCNDIS